MAGQEAAALAYSPEAANQMAQTLAGLIDGLQAAAQSAQAITQVMITTAQAMAVEDQWVATWGEIISKKDAAKMLGCSIGTVNKLIRENKLPPSNDGRILVRQAAQWANRLPDQAGQARREPPRKPKDGKRFIK